MTSFNSIRSWMGRFGQATPVSPTLPTLEDLRLRDSLIKEESAEVAEIIALFRVKYGMGSSPTGLDMVRLAKELADLIIVAYGTFATLGLDGDTIVRMVIDNNEKKLASGLFNGIGKLVPPPDTKKLLKAEVEEQIANHLQNSLAPSCHSGMIPVQEVTYGCSQC